MSWGAQWNELAEEGEEFRPAPPCCSSAWAAALLDVADVAGGDVSDEGMSCASSGSPPSECDPAGGAPADGHGSGECGVEAALALIVSTPSPLQRMELLARASRVVEDVRLDAEAMHVASCFLDDKDHVTNTTAGAAAVGVDRKFFRTVRLGCSSAAHHMEKHFWARLEATLAEQAEANRVKLLFYLDISSYDGVDLKLATTSNVIADDSGKIVKLSDLAARAREGGEATAAACDFECNVGKAKILNTEVEIAMVIEVQGECAILHGDFLTLLQAVDRNTGEALFAALRQQDFGSPHREHFERRCRMAITDAAGYSFRAERGILNSNGESWSHLHFRCQVHVTAAVHTSVYGLLPDVISGMIGVSLSLSDFGQMTLFRTALKRVLSKNLKLVYELPSGPAATYRAFVLDTLVGTSARVLPLRIALIRCASGDWRRPDVFEYLATPSDTRDSVLQFLFGHFPSSWRMRQRLGQGLAGLGLIILCKTSGSSPASTRCSRMCTALTWRRTTAKRGERLRLHLEMGLLALVGLMRKATLLQRSVPSMQQVEFQIGPARTRRTGRLRSTGCGRRVALIFS